MKKNHLVQILAGAFALAALSANAAEINNWQSTNGAAVKNAYGECWRNSSWTPATALPGCDGALVAPVISVIDEVKPKPVAPKPGPAPEPEPVVIKKFRLLSDALFDFDKSTLKADGKAQLDDLASKLKEVNPDMVMAKGHTDSKGTDAYNLVLSKKRAQAVKNHLVSRGVDPKFVTIDGAGEFEPAATNASSEGRTKNRRVEIEAVGVLK